MAQQRISDIISSDFLYMDEQCDSSTDSIDESVLSVGLSDKPAMLWGAVVYQKPGTVLAAFTPPEKATTILFVNRGRLSVAINGKPFVVSPGQALVILSGETCVGTEPHQTELSFQWLNIEIDQPRQSSKASTVQLSRITSVGDPSMVSELLRLLTEEYHKLQVLHPGGASLTSQAGQLLLLSVLARLKPAEAADSPTSDALTALAERARDYMRANADKPCTVADVAKYLECSDGYLRTAFRLTYGYSPGTFLLRIRMHRARYLLNRTRLTIDQVARQCGYNNPGYFSRVFTQRHGMTPSRYRSSHSRQYVTQGI